MTYRGPWNAAGLRHRQAPRKYVKVGAVGDPSNHNAPECQGCKMHVCSCPKTVVKRETRITSVAEGSYKVEQKPIGYATEDIPAGALCTMDFTTGRLSPVKVGQPETPAPKACPVAGCELSNGHHQDCTSTVRCVPHGTRWNRLASDAGCVTCRAEKQRQLQADMQPVRHVRTSLPCLKCENCTTLVNNLVDGRCVCCRPRTLMFEGSPLKVGDRIVNAETASELEGVVTAVDDKYVVYAFRYRADGRWCSGPPFRFELSKLIQEGGWRRC